MRAFTRTRIPGVQKPHCRAPEAAKAAANRSRSAGSKPSRVVIDLPATFSREIWQLTDALPSMSTVQQPHWPDGEHPSLAEVRSELLAQCREKSRMVANFYRPSVHRELRHRLPFLTPEAAQ